MNSNQCNFNNINKKRIIMKHYYQKSHQLKKTDIYNCLYDSYKTYVSTRKSLNTNIGIIFPKMGIKLLISDKTQL